MAKERIYQCSECEHVSAIFWSSKDGFACANCLRLCGAHIKNRKLTPSEIRSIKKQFDSSQCAYCKESKCVECGRKGSYIR